MATDLTDSQKINNLWKSSKGVVDINKPENFVSSTEKGAIKNVLNDSIFSEEVPDKIPGTTINLNTLGGPNAVMPVYSVAALDLSFNFQSLEPGQVPPSTPMDERSSAIGGGFEGLKLTSVGLPHLVYYHRIPLVEVNSANTTPNNKCKTSWYLPDPSNNNMSSIRNTINFKKGNLAQGHYNQKFFIYDVLPGPVYNYQSAPQQLDDPYYFVFDNESGYVLIYGEADNSPIWYLETAANRRICVSFIRYEGALGASGGGPDGLQEGNVNLMQTLEIQGGTPKYHPQYNAALPGLGPTTYDHFFAMANYVIAEVENTAACAMGYFTLKIIGNGYDTTCQFIATILENNIPSIKILSSSVKDPLAGFGKLIMYDNRSVNGKWYICLGFDQTLRVGLNPSQPYYRGGYLLSPAFPSWWNGASAPMVDVVRITLVNNNANQNDNTLIPAAVGNWELNTPVAFFDPTLAPIHSGGGLWQIGNFGTAQPNPANTFVDRYKLVCNLLIGDATPDMNLSSDTAVNVFHNDIVMDTNTKIKILDLSSNSASNTRTGFYEFVSGGHHSHDLGTVTMEAEQIYLKSAKVTDINSTINVNGSINFGNYGWILNGHYGVFQEIQYTDGNFTSNDSSPGSGGEWVTIARTTLSPLAKTRSASAIFEIIDKSNTIDNAAVNGTTDLSGNFDPASFDEYILASVSWRYDVNDIRGLVSPTLDPNTLTIAPADVHVNIINSRCGINTGTGSAPRGYIGKLRVQTGLYTMPVAGGDRVAVANLQLYRYANGVQAPNGTRAGKTDVKVRMVCNNLTDISNNTTNWEFSSTAHNLAVVHPTESSMHIMEYNLIEELDINSRFRQVNNRKVLNLNGGMGDKVVIQDLYFESPSGITGLGESFTNSLYTKNYYNDELENVALCRLSSFDLQDISGAQVGNNEWVTIAAVGVRDLTARRADALFELTERTSGIQQTVIFRAGLCYSRNNSNTTIQHENNYIELISNRTYESNVTFKKLRIMFNGYNTSSGLGSSTSTPFSSRGTIYGGGVLQVQIDTASVSGRARGKCYLKMYQNTRQRGWVSNDDVFAKYSESAAIPVWDTTYNNSSDSYSSNKFIDLSTTKNTQISTQKKSWKLYNLSGYPEDNKNTSSVWPGTSSGTGYPLNIKLNNWLDMGGSTVVNLWDSPESWVDGGTTIRRNGINLDDINEYRAKSVVNLRTVNKYYQKYRAPLVPYVGTQKQINEYVHEANMEHRFRTSEGVITHLIEPSSSYAINNSVPEIQGLLYYNKFLAKHYMLSNGVMNLSWGTSIYQDINWLNGTIPTDFTGNGQMTGIGDWDFTNVSNAQSVGPVATSGDAIADGKLGWDRVTTTQHSTGGEIKAIARAGLIFSSNGYSNPGISGTKLRFRAHKSGYGKGFRSVVKWKNDSIFYPNSDGYFNNKRSSINSPYDIWHHMPQKNMSGYILGATLYGYVEIRNGTSVWDTSNDEYKVIFCLIGAKYNNNSYSSIQELTDFVTIDGNTLWNGNIGPNVTANNGDYLKFYPNGGTGELSKAIFIGKNGTYTSSSGHPGQGTTDQRFDALGIRVKVEMTGTANSSSSQQRPEIHLLTSRTNRIIFHFLPLMSGVYVPNSNQLESDGVDHTVP